MSSSVSIHKALANLLLQGFVTPACAAEHCLFFKSIEDANKLRRQIAESFERAALPGIPVEVRRKTDTHFVGMSKTYRSKCEETITILVQSLLSKSRQVKDNGNCRMKGIFSCRRFSNG